MAAIFKITDGIESISLIGGSSFYVRDWRPAPISFKGDGYWQDPVFAEGRRLKHYAMANIIENIVLAQTAPSQDEAILLANRLGRILLRAAEYAVHPKHGRRPVYMEVKATDESSARYAIIHNGFVGEYGNPFDQPFMQPGCRSAVVGLNLIIERSPWLEAPPGTDVCQVVTPTGTRIGDTTITKYDYADLVLANAPSLISYPPFALYKLNETSGTTAENSSVYGDILDGGHDGTTLEDLTFWNGVDPTTFIPITAGVVDIYSADFNSLFDGDEGSIIAWVNTSGLIWTGGNDAYFVNIETSDSYVRIYHPGATDNSITWAYTTPTHVHSHNETDFSTSLRWFSVGITWNKAQNRIRAYLDGAMVDVNEIVGSWDNDIGAGTCIIGASNSSGDDGASSTMAYVGFWNKELTPQDMALIGVESDDRVSDIDFDSFDCDEIVAYVSNKQNSAQITHVFRHDSSAATFSSNLLTSDPPYAILPSPIGANDAVYFGVQQTSDSARPAGPFNSLVLDVSTDVGDLLSSYTTAWQYWDGSAWSALPNVVDRTEGINDAAFEITGINSVHWDQPGDWATNTIATVTGHWVRALVSAVSGTWTQPIVSDHPYTIIRNRLDIPRQAVGGSMPSLARITWENRTSTNTDRVVIGMRSRELSPNFISYINLADEQNSGFVQVTRVNTAETSFQDNPTSASGRALDLTESAGASAMQDIFRVTINSGISESFLGSFKAFIIYNADADSTSAETEFGWRLGGNSDYTTIDTGVYINTSNHTVHELGEITIRPDTFIGDNLGQLHFVWRSEITTNMTIDFYALVLIPTDEWFGDFDGVPVSQPIPPIHEISVDGTRYIDRSLVADVRISQGGQAVGRLLQSHNGPPVVLHDRDSEFHFFFMTDNGENYEAIPTQSGRVRIYRNRRYHYGRGLE